MVNYDEYIPQVVPEFDPYGGPGNAGQLIYGDVRTRSDKYEDAFGNNVVQNTQIRADLAGHYPFSPERWHLYNNGTRIFPQYGDVPQLIDEPDIHRLIPQNAGDVVTLETTETFRYIVGYVLEFSGAFQTNQPLQSGDAIAFGYGNPDFENSADDTPGPNADGWFMKWDSRLDPNEVRLCQYRGGTEQYSRVYSTNNDITDWTRYEGKTNWYAVGRTRYGETFTSDAQATEGPRQANERIGSTGVLDERGPHSGNQRVRYSIKAGDGVGSLELEAGSAAIKSLGRGTTIVREKTHEFNNTAGVANAWTPIHAMRIGPNFENINIQISKTDIIAYSDTDSVKLTIQTFDASNVADANGNPLDDTDFSTPPSHSGKNSALEVTNNVAQFADETGTLVTSTQNPGGYQVGYASWYTTGTGSKTRASGGGTTRKRQLPDGDIAVVLAYADQTTDPVIGEIITQQDW